MTCDAGALERGGPRPRVCSALERGGRRPRGRSAVPLWRAAGPPGVWSFSTCVFRLVSWFAFFIFYEF
jgi:hypothetical protein